MYPNLASVLVGSNDLLDQTVNLPNLGSFTETINYSYKDVSEETIGYTLSSYIAESGLVNSTDWYQYWGGKDDKPYISKNFNLMGNALAYALDEEYYIIDKYR